jgi:hypothetical protein
MYSFVQPVYERVDRPEAISSSICESKNPSGLANTLSRCHAFDILWVSLALNQGRYDVQYISIVRTVGQKPLVPLQGKGVDLYRGSS